MLVLIIVLIVVVVVAASLSGALVVRGRRRATPLPARPPAPPRSPPASAPPLPAAEELGAPDGDTALDEPAVDEPGAEIAAEELGVDAVDLDEAVAETPAADGAVAAPRFRDRLGKARSLLGGYLASVRSRDRIDDATWVELEEALILADVGVDATDSVLTDLRARVRAERIDTAEELVDALKEDLVARMDGDRELRLVPDVTNVWLFVGVNGVGKTTTIGKIGLRQHEAGRRIVMAAGDTFRAAAADQLQLWAERVDAELVRGNEGGDPGAVIFDAVQHAAARGADLVLADTAGRLHTKVNLMEELKKVRRVAERPPGHVSEVLLVIDATTGQNGLVQAKQFAQAVAVTGIVLTKLDGTARGGIAFAIEAELGIPIKLVGLGEGAADLVDFDPVEFVEALVSA